MEKNYKKYSFFIPDELFDELRESLDENMMNDYLIESLKSKLKETSREKNNLESKKSTSYTYTPSPGDKEAVYPFDPDSSSTGFIFDDPDIIKMYTEQDDALQQSFTDESAFQSTCLNIDKSISLDSVPTIEVEQGMVSIYEPYWKEGSSHLRAEGDYEILNIGPLDWLSGDDFLDYGIGQTLVSGPMGDIRKPTFPPPRTFPSLFILFHLFHHIALPQFDEIVGDGGLRPNSPRGKDSMIDSKIFEYNILLQAFTVSRSFRKKDKIDKTMFKLGAGFPMDSNSSKAAKRRFLSPNLLYLLVNKYISYTGVTYSITKKGVELVKGIDGISLQYPHSEDLIQNYFKLIKEYEPETYPMFQILIDCLSEPISKKDFNVKYEKGLGKHYGYVDVKQNERGAKERLGEEVKKKLKVPTPYGGHDIEEITSSMIGKAREWGLVEKNMVNRQYLLAEDINIDLFK